MPTGPLNVIYLPDDVIVQPWIDPGTGASAGASAYAVLPAALWGGRTYILDEIYVHGMIDTEVIAIAQERWWYAQIMKQKRPVGVMDVAGTHQHGQTTNLAVWTKRTGISFITQKVFIHEGEGRVRRALRGGPDGPDLYVHPNCLWTRREATRLYRYPVDDKGDPISKFAIDRDNHAWKAIGYGLYATKGPDAEDYTARRRKIKHNRKTPWGYVDDLARYRLPPRTG